MTSYGSRTVIHGDGIAWLAEQGVLAGASIVTSLPDQVELQGVGFDDWRTWFGAAARACIVAAPDDGVTIFYQTDVRRDGVWVDKGYLVLRAAEAAGVDVLWHKVVCRVPPGAVDQGRPGYAHLICVSRGVRDVPRRSTPDVLPDTGPSSWSRGTGAIACEVACRAVLELTPTRHVVDPCCGRGTILAVANRLGLDATGVDISRRATQHARRLRL